MQTQPLQINYCLSFTETDYGMSFNFSAVRVIPKHDHSVEGRNLKLPGCKILGTAARTLALLTKFSCAAEAAIWTFPSRNFLTHFTNYGKKGPSSTGDSSIYTRSGARRKSSFKTAKNTIINTS